MKKLFKITLVLAATMMISTSSFAQFEKGKWQIGGSTSLGFNSGKANSDAEDATSRFSFSPNAGYFLIDNLAAGLNINIAGEKTGDISQSIATFGPFVRYYTSLKIYGQLSYGIGSIKTKDVDAAGDKISTTDNTSDLGIAVGYAIMLNDFICIDPSLGYHMTSYKPDGGDSFNGSNFGLNVGITLFLGSK